MRIAVILLAIVTVPVVFLGVLLINTSQEAVRNSVLNNHRQIVTRAAEEIELFIETPRSILDTAAPMLGVSYPAPWKQETILVELVLNQPILMRVSSVDLAGRELASSELGRELNRDYPPEILQEVKAGKDYISQVKIMDNHTPFVTMAVPIKKMGRTIGALIADVNLRGIWKMVDNIRLGETGRAFLVSHEGILIAHQDKKRVLRNENLREQKEVQAVLAGKTEAIELEGNSGSKWISSYAPIAGLGWGIILRQSQDEAYWFSKVMRIQSWIIIILSEIVAILVSIFMGRVFAQPIKTLSSRIKRVADGDLEHKIKIERRDDMGELVRSFNDMTAKLKQAKARERLSAIGEAASWIAHELKNSLVSIKSFVQLFPRRHHDESFVNKFSRLIPEEVNHWERMLKELSEFSAQSELRTCEVNLKQLLDDILAIMMEKFIEKKIDIKYNLQNKDICIQADPHRLRQVFMNLIINAVNAMPQGGSLIVSIDRRPGYVDVSIKDTGKGIARDTLNRIFEPFHTTNRGSMGLGLAISRRIVEQHGGNIDVESEIDMGTTFIVRLPV